MRGMFELCCWLLPPSRLKNAILRRFGHRIAVTARIGPIMVLGVGRFEIGEHTCIGPFNVFKDLSLVRMDDVVDIGSFNWVSAARDFQEIDPQAGTLHFGNGAGMRSRNYLDCSGTILVGPYAAIGGQRVFLQSHEPDFEHHRQTASRIVVGHHSVTASGSMMLAGARLPDQSVLAANSTMLAPKATDELPRGVYAGSPAKWKAETRGEWYVRTTHRMPGTIGNGPMGPATDDPAFTEWKAVVAVE
jgi:acetyltransferase-like isoleucine patch superfamily enzyme